MLQLVVRSQYNGKGALRGKVESSSRRQLMIPPALRHSPKFFVQVSSRAEECFGGCCLRKTHPRLYTLHETHFLAFYREYWDLYVKEEEEVTHHQHSALCCVLVPQLDARTILECRNWGPWKFLGTCHASVLRTELEAMVEAYYHSYHCQQRRQMMVMNGMTVLNDTTNTSTPRIVDGPTFPYYWHLDLYMDSMEDYYGKKYNQRAATATNSAAQRSNDPPSLLRCRVSNSSSGGRGVARFDRADRRHLVDCSKATAADPGGPFWGFAWVGGGGSGTSQKIGTKLDAACITHQNSHSAAAAAAMDDDDNNRQTTTMTSTTKLSQ